MKFDSKTLLWVGIPFLVVGTIAVVVAPIIFTRDNIGIEFNATTGVIGDTIGGITAPIVNLIGAILVFFALYAQVEANEELKSQNEKNQKELENQSDENKKQVSKQNDEQIEQKNFANLLEIYKQIKDDFDDFEITSELSNQTGSEPVIRKGRKALDLFFDELHQEEKTILRDIESMDINFSKLRKTEYSSLLHTFKVFAFLSEKLTSEKLADSDRSTLMELSKYLFLSRFEGLIPNEFKLPKELFDLVKNISTNLNLQTNVEELVPIPF
jgi:hypothetical protein